MKSFLVYDVLTGTILRTGTCQEEAFELQAMHEHEAVMEGEGNALSQRVDPETRTLVSI